jgi:hypothetical protein
MNTFWQHLSHPEYVHVLINPLPVYGLAIGMLALVLALILRTPKVTTAALVLVFIAGLSAWPTYYYGEAGYDRVKATSDDAGGKWLDEHMARGEKLIWAFYLLAGVSAMGMVAVARWPRCSSLISVLMLVLGTTTLGIGAYIAYAGGHVRHREFRFEPPPESREDAHHDGESAMDHGNTPTKPAETETLRRFSLTNRPISGFFRADFCGVGVGRFQTLRRVSADNVTGDKNVLTLVDPTAAQMTRRE